MLIILLYSNNDRIDSHYIVELTVEVQADINEEDHWDTKIEAVLLLTNWHIALWQYKFVRKILPLAASFLGSLIYIHNHDGGVRMVC